MGDHDYAYTSFKYRPRPSSPSFYDRSTRPQEVDDFLTGVQVEASKPNNNNRYSTPQNAAAFGRPTVYSSPTPGYGGYGDYRTGTNYGGYSSSDEDDDDEEYNHKPSHVNMIRPIDQPPIKLGMPTNSIGEAVDYLKGAGTRTEPVKPHGTEYVKPYGSNFNSTSQAVKPYGTYGSYYKSSDSVKPYGYGSDMKNTESVKPHGTYGSDVQPAGSVKPYSTYGSDRYSTDSVKPYGTYGSNVKNTESVKPYGTYGSDSKSTANQAAKPYGPKYPIDSTTGQPVIDCYEAARRYKGTVIRI